jgi:hypothetical protein
MRRWWNTTNSSTGKNIGFTMSKVVTVFGSSRPTEGDEEYQ